MDILQKLKKYFEENTEEQILKDWQETKNDDCVNAPTVEQFLLYNVGQRSELFNDKKCDKFNEEVEQLKNDLGSSGNW
tara:strand:+ start:412 stop:645 length:234 start_codon:yes stop_codon:yes gene_type:complete